VPGRRNHKGKKDRGFSEGRLLEMRSEKGKLKSIQ
jgi:hypothetical protein